MPYRVHMIEKRVERDDVNDGCIGDDRIVMTGSDSRPVTRDTLQSAIADAFNAYDLPVDYFFVVNADEDGTAGFVTCNRNEDGDGYPVNGSIENPKAVRLSEAGDLWLAEYTFSVEYVESRPATLAELRAAFPQATIEG